MHISLAIFKLSTPIMNNTIIERDQEAHEPTLSRKPYHNNPDIIYHREQPKRHNPSQKEYHSSPDILYEKEPPRQYHPSPKQYRSGHDAVYQREHPKQHGPSLKEYPVNPDIIYEREEPPDHLPSQKEYRDSPETVHKREPIHEEYYDAPEIVYKPEHEHRATPKYYHDVPETGYKNRHFQNQKFRPYTTKPSTYQYEVDTDGYGYSHPKRPSAQAYQSPPRDAYNAYEKEYPANKYRYQIPDDHEEDLKEERYVTEDHDGYRNPTVAKSAEYHHPKRVILPQTGDQNGHIYDDENPHHNYPGKERHVIKYDYDGENKLVYPELPKEAPSHSPVSHQYIRVIEEPQHPVSASYEKEKTPYIHRPITHVRPESQPHSVVVLDPRNQVHPVKQEIVYRERAHEQPRPDTYHVHQQNHPAQYEEKIEEAPKINHREPMRYNSKHDEHEPLQKAVLELNSDVYKEFIENKSPGRIVAIPINQLNNGHSDSSKSHLYPVSGKPHGVLHIPLDGKTQSTIDLKNLPLVLQVPNGKDVRHQKPQDIHQERIVEHDKLPIIYAHGSRSPTVSVPKSSGRLNKNKEYEKSKWIPMTPSWRNKQGRKSHEDDAPVVKHHPTQESRIPRVALRLSDGGIYQILQTESSERLTNIKKKPSKSKAARRLRSRSRKEKAKQTARTSS